MRIFVIGLALLLSGCAALNLPKTVVCRGKGTITVTGGLGGALTADCGEKGFSYHSQ